MPLATAAINYALDQLGTNKLRYASLHSAYSATGANELNGGSPAYARKSLTWEAADNGGMALSGSYVFDVPPAATVAWVGFWDSDTSGTFQGMAPAGSGQPLAFVASASSDTLTVPGHSFSNGDTVVVLPAPGATLPTGLTVGTIYYVVGASGSTLQLATTQGGSAINLTADGAGIIQSITPEVYAGQGTYTLADPSVGDALSIV